MGTSLLGLTPANTYPALIKVGDNNGITSTLKTLSDGSGTNLPMQVSTTGVNFTGTVTGIPSAVSGVAGAIQFSNGSAFASDASNLFWDDTNNRFGVGTNAPTNTFEIASTSTSPFKVATTASYFRAIFQNSGASGILDFNSSSFQFPTNNVEFGTSSSLGARVGIKGSGSTSATTALSVQNNSGTTILSISDDTEIRSYASRFHIRSLVDHGGWFQTNATQSLQITNNAYNNGTACALNLNGMGVLINSLPTNLGASARLQIVGQGSTSSTTALLVQNSAGTTALEVLDDSRVKLGNSADFTVYSGAAVVSRFAMNIGSTSLPTAQLQVKGSGSTSATTSLLVQNSSGSAAFQIKDDLQVSLPSTATNNILAIGGQVGPSKNGVGVGYTSGGSVFVRGGLFVNPNTDVCDLYGSTNSVMSWVGNTVLFKEANNGSSFSQPSALVSIDSSTQGFLPPRMTTTQKNAIATPASGLVVYDSTTNKLCCYNGSTWNDLF